MDDEKAHEERHEVLNCSDASFEPPWRRARVRKGKVVAEREKGVFWIAFAFGKGRGPPPGPVVPRASERGYRFRFTGRRLFGEDQKTPTLPLPWLGILFGVPTSLIRVRVRVTIRVFKGALHDMDPFQITVHGLGGSTEAADANATLDAVVPVAPLGVETRLLSGIFQ